MPYWHSKVSKVSPAFVVTYNIFYGKEAVCDVNINERDYKTITVVFGDWVVSITVVQVENTIPIYYGREKKIRLIFDYLKGTESLSNKDRAAVFATKLKLIPNTLNMKLGVFTDGL